MMGGFVVGYDGSDCAKAALADAMALAKPLGEKVTVVFGYAPPGIWGGEIAEHEEAVEEYGAKATAEARKQAADAGMEIEVELVAKRPAEALVDLAAERDARMIVVGSYSETPLKGAILGSTPYKLLHESEVPVLVVPVPR